MVVEVVVDYQVDVGVLVQVEDFVVGVQVQVDLWVCGVEVVEMWYQLEGGEGWGGGDCQVVYVVLWMQCVDVL